ncbi:MAG: DUF1287 domain-containing protein [Gammaproteobacteria bacterium]|nr:DUF1287 domain-containing protein [Gammaproteobacteria bacterium]
MKKILIIAALVTGLVANLLNAEPIISAENLVKAANERTKSFVIYNGAYRKIAYPMGDVPENIGVCTDVVIRSYRQLGIDLQELVHKDMKTNFAKYPKIWGLTRPDTNIDHRRVPNLETFFERHGTVLKISQNSTDYQPGDIVSWRLDNNLPHIGIVSDIKDERSGNYKLVHNIGMGPKLEDMLFDYKIVGHYRYFPES